MKGEGSRFYTVVLGGLLRETWREVESSLPEQQPGTVVMRCHGRPAEVLLQCSRIAPCVLVISQAFLGPVDPGEFEALTDSGRSVRVLVEVETDDLHIIETVLRMGCSGVVNSKTPVEILKKAVLAVASHELWISRSAVSWLLPRLLNADKRRLTGRENEILRLVGSGLKNHEIAARLFISPQTVRWHLRSLYSKLGTSDRARAEILGGIEAEGCIEI